MEGKANYEEFVIPKRMHRQSVDYEAGRRKVTTGWFAFAKGAQSLSTPS